MLTPRLLLAAILSLCSAPFSFSQAAPAAPAPPLPPTVLGYHDFAAEQQLEQQFLAVPEAKLAEEHLRTLTAKPHLAGTPEDKETADYVARKFREAGLDTQITEYKVWMNRPLEISVDVVYPKIAAHHGPAREHVEGDPFQDDPRVVMPFNGSSASGDAEAEVVYANYGRREDFQKLDDMKIDVRGKIVLVRYGENYRGVKAYIAEQHGAAGVIIYSDPYDDGYFQGDKYPAGPWRPDSGVQRGSVGYMFMFPGDPTTPGVASLPSLPDGQRTSPASSPSQPRILCTPISYADAQPILQNLSGPVAPHGWQGALPFAYHLGPGPVRVKMHLKQDYQYRTIWDVTGVVRGSTQPDEWVVGGNHRDAWVYGAVDPNSGTAAMLESVHGVGELLKSGWRPKRTMIFASWDAEEEGLIGSTEWAEQHAKELEQAAAYFNMDVAVSGPNFGASAVPSLKQFVREVTKSISSPAGRTLYEVWKEQKEKKAKEGNPLGPNEHEPVVSVEGNDVPVGDLGSGSDYTAFLQHLGVPSSDVSSTGPYGVYHSVFDNFNWFKKFGDPTFAYEQEMARVFGLELVRMSNADVLPYDYETYGKEIVAYLEAAQKRAAKQSGKTPDFSAALTAAHRLTSTGVAIAQRQKDPNADAAKLNVALRQAERALILPKGLPDRPWFQHAIYAPGKYTGYAAVVIPGVNEAIDDKKPDRVQEQLAELAAALNRAADVLESGSR